MTDPRISLVAALKELRYSAQVGGALATDGDESAFLHEVVGWIRSYGRVLADVSETTTNMAAELQELRSQRKAVRDFLGLTTTAGEQ